MSAVAASVVVRKSTRPRVSVPSFADATIAHAVITAALGLMRDKLAILADSALAVAPRAEVDAIIVRSEALLTQARAAVKHVAV